MVKTNVAHQYYMENPSICCIKRKFEENEKTQTPEETNDFKAIWKFWMYIILVLFALDLWVDEESAFFVVIAIKSIPSSPQNLNNNHNLYGRLIWLRNYYFFNKRQFIVRTTPSKNTSFHFCANLLMHLFTEFGYMCVEFTIELYKLTRGSSLHLSSVYINS